MKVWQFCLCFLLLLACLWFWVQWFQQSNAQMAEEKSRLEQATVINNPLVGVAEVSKANAHFPMNPPKVEVMSNWAGDGEGGQYRYVLLDGRLVAENSWVNTYGAGRFFAFVPERMAVASPWNDVKKEVSSP